MDTCIFVFFFLFVFFLRGDHIDPVVLKYQKRGRLNENWSSGALFKRPKRLESKYNPSSFFFSESSCENFEIAISFSIVERPNNYGSGDNTIPNRPWRKVLTNFG